MVEKRVRATFLLKLVVLAASVGVFVFAFLLATSRPIQLGTIVFLSAFWLIGIEGELLPRLIERLAIRRAARTVGPVDSVWFIDVEAEERRKKEAHAREMERMREATRDNPTLW
jgi:hypothetical protein